MRKKLCSGKMLGILAALLVLAMAAGIAEQEDRTDAGGQWMYFFQDGLAVIKGPVEEPAGDLKIPDALDGYTVGGVGDNAFMLCGGITSVTFGNNVARIGSNAFMGCGSLTDIIIPYGVTYIGGAAFLGSGLISATIPASVTGIGRDAFDGCEGLVLSVPQGSFAALYARENDIAHVLTPADNRGADGPDGAWRTAGDDGDFTTLLLYPDDAFRLYQYNAQDDTTLMLEGVRIVQDGLFIVYDTRTGILDADGAYTQTGETGTRKYGFTLVQDGTPALRLTDDYGITIMLFPFDMDAPG